MPGDIYGGLTLPPFVGTATPVTLTAAAGDPLLDALGSYLQTTLNTYGLTPWQSVAPGKSVVSQIRLHDPEKNGFDTKDLPALYVFRDDDSVATQVEWIASDYRSETGLLHVLWVPPDDVQDKRRLRVPVGNLVGKIVDASIEAGRDPAWVVSGDADPQAAASGSQILVYAGCEWLELATAKWRKINIPMLDGGAKSYDALAMDLHVRDLLSRDITQHTFVTKADTTFVAPDEGTGLGPLTVGEQIYT